MRHLPPLRYNRGLHHLFLSYVSCCCILLLLSLITAYMYLHHDGGPQLDQTYILSFRQSHTTLEFKTMYSIMTIGYQLLMTLWSAYQPYGFVDKTQAIYKKCSAVVDSCNHLVLFRIRQPRLMTVF